MGIYETLAETLLKDDNFIFFTSSEDDNFGFTRKKEYTGLMARAPKRGPNKGKIKRRKQGLFDFVVNTGNRYDGNVTHKKLFNDLLKFSNQENCIRVWLGEDPREFDGIAEDEKVALITLTLLMFEQEVNWGREDWQRNSNFSPRVTKPTQIRPRDMLMGFLLQAFDLGLEEVKFWMESIPGTCSFRGKFDGKEILDYNSYPKQFKKYFTTLNENGAPKALMTDNVRKKFKEYADNSVDNPGYTEGKRKH